MNLITPNLTKDFRKFALGKGVSPSAFDDVVHSVEDSAMTPVVLEERELRATAVDIFSRLLYDRVIFLSGEVNNDSMDLMVAQLLYLDSIDHRDISLYINSPGGDCYSGLELISVMDFVKSDISTVVLGMAASMGAVISSNGTHGKRYMLPYSRIMVHQPLSKFGYNKFTDSKIALKELESVRNDLYEVIAKNSGQPIEEVVRLCENGDHWMKADEAIAVGLCDSVIK